MRNKEKTETANLFALRVEFYLSSVQVTKATDNTGYIKNECQNLIVAF